MSREIDFKTYLFLDNSKFVIYVIDNVTNEKIYSEKLVSKENFLDLKFNELNKFLELNVFKIEKILINFINDIYIIWDSKEFH